MFSDGKTIAVGAPLNNGYGRSFWACSSVRIVMGSGTNKVPTSMVKLLVTILDIESLYHED